jgi:hypothetical protein
MTYIKNNKTLVVIIAILLLSNIALLYFLTRCRKDCKSDQPKQENTNFRKMMMKRLKEEVGFDTTQIAKYEELSKKHKEAMKPLFTDLTNAKDSFYKLLLQPQPSDSLKKHYLQKIGEKQELADQRLFNHFNTLRQECTEAQRPKYDSVIQDVIKGMITFPNNKKDNKDNKTDKKDK